MPLNKQTGNMYGFITHTWNPIKGKCYHDCSYCSIKKITKRYNHVQKPPALYNDELKIKLGTGNFIFVGSSIDMFAQDIITEWIQLVLDRCCQYPENTYLFQSKNPTRFLDFDNEFPTKHVLCTTIETNRFFSDIMGKSPYPYERIKYIYDAKHRGHNTMITIEPIMEFDMDSFLPLLAYAKPDFLNIGADSKKCGLPEPDKGKIIELMDGLHEVGINPYIKENLWRLIG